MNHLDYNGDGKLSREELQRAFSLEFISECSTSDMGEVEYCEKLDRYIRVLKALGMIDAQRIADVKKDPFQDPETATKTTKAIIRILKKGH